MSRPRPALKPLLGVALFPLAACSAPPEPAAPHHTEDGFRNLHPHDDHGLDGVVRWTWERRTVRVERTRFPLADNDPEFLRENRDRPTLTWIGHATFLLQFAGLNILTDPHLTSRASPVGWAGPERTTPPGLALSDLPEIDLVVISHNHYDHLDLPTLRRLADRDQRRPLTCYAPLELAPLLEKAGIDRVVELDWWQSARLGEWTIHAVPVQHFSARTPFDRNETLWAGWVLEHPGLKFFFAGDTGYSPDFSEIRRRLGPVDLAAIPIGAYEPRWFMRAMHLNPEEAVRVHLDLEARYSVAMHWGTFILTDEPQDEPPRRLAAAGAAAAVPPERFFVLRHGETRALDFLTAEE